MFFISYVMTFFKQTQDSFPRCRVAPYLRILQSLLKPIKPNDTLYVYIFFSPQEDQVSSFFRLIIIIELSGDDSKYWRFKQCWLRSEQGKYFMSRLFQYRASRRPCPGKICWKLERSISTHLSCSCVSTFIFRVFLHTAPAKWKQLCCGASLALLCILSHAFWGLFLCTGG